jgi:hypothetical protein
VRQVRAARRRCARARPGVAVSASLPRCRACADRRPPRSARARSEKKTANKFIDASHFANALTERTSSGSSIHGGFGAVLPRHPASHSRRMLESTAMASWQ